MRGGEIDIEVGIDVERLTLKPPHTSSLAFAPSSIGATIDSISPSVDLVDGAQYSVQLKYQDGAGNPATSETHTGIYFAALTTLPPTLSSPSQSSSIREYVCSAKGREIWSSHTHTRPALSPLSLNPNPARALALSSAQRLWD